MYIMYYLARDPALQQTLREELAKAVPAKEQLQWKSIATLPLLDAIIQETLRMHPPVPSGLTRETPPEGMYISNVFIPPDTHVSCPTWTLQRDERYFTQGHDWIPERWFSRPELIKDKGAFFPFSVGPYNCAGKYFALMEQKIFIATVVMAFEITFAPGEDGTEMITGPKDYFTTFLPDLSLCLKPSGMQA